MWMMINANETDHEPKPCPGGCDHSRAQHRAFDAGLAAGEAGLGDETNPETDLALREDWRIGYSIGWLNRDLLTPPLLPDV